MQRSPKKKDYADPTLTVYIFKVVGKEMAKLAILVNFCSKKIKLKITISNHL